MRFILPTLLLTALPVFSHASPWMNISGSILANHWKRKPVNTPLEAE